MLVGEEWGGWVEGVGGGGGGGGLRNGVVLNSN